MESSAARKEELKNIDDEVKAQLQKILNKLNNYIRESPSSVRSTSKNTNPARLENIKNIATLIYNYYEMPRLYKNFANAAPDLKTLLLKEFDSNMTDFFAAIDSAQKNPVNLNEYKLLPELKDIYHSEPLPRSLHKYHNILTSIRAEMKKLSDPPLKFVGATWKGSTLKKEIADALVGADNLAQKLGTNVYLVIYSDDLSKLELERKPEDLAQYIYEALTTARVYQSTSIYTFKSSDRSYHIAFCSSKEEARSRLAMEGFPNAGCIGAEFSFALHKTPSEAEGQYIPLIETVKKMEVWKRIKDQYTPNYQLFSNEHDLEKHSSKPVFTIVPTERPTLSKK